MLRSLLSFSLAAAFAAPAFAARDLSAVPATAVLVEAKGAEPAVPAVKAEPVGAALVEAAEKGRDRFGRGPWDRPGRGPWDRPGPGDHRPPWPGDGRPDRPSGGRTPSVSAATTGGGIGGTSRVGTSNSADAVGPARRRGPRRLLGQPRRTPARLRLRVPARRGSRPAGELGRAARGLLPCRGGRHGPLPPRQLGTPGTLPREPLRAAGPGPAPQPLSLKTFKG